MEKSFMEKIKTVKKRMVFMNDLEMNFQEISDIIEFRRNNAYKKVNEELISLYWDIGKYISEKVNSSQWGDKIVEK